MALSEYVCSCVYGVVVWTDVRALVGVPLSVFSCWANRTDITGEERNVVVCSFDNACRWWYFSTVGLEYQSGSRHRSNWIWSEFPPVREQYNRIHLVAPWSLIYSRVCFRAASQIPGWHRHSGFWVDESWRALVTEGDEYRFLYPGIPIPMPPLVIVVDLSNIRSVLSEAENQRPE